MAVGRTFACEAFIKQGALQRRVRDAGPQKRCCCVWPFVQLVLLLLLFLVLLVLLVLLLLLLRWARRRCRALPLLVDELEELAQRL